VLTDENFYRTVAEHSTLLVYFYAPWCKYCQDLQLIYEQVGEILAEKHFGAALAKIDATQNPEMAEKFDVLGYPTLKLFLNGPEGEVIDFVGDHDQQGLVFDKYTRFRDIDHFVLIILAIIEWLDEKTQPNYKPSPSAVLTLTSDNFSEYTTKSDIILVEFYSPR